MICSNCKKEVTGNKSICLYCGSVIKKNVKAKQPGSTKTSKGVKNKYIKEDQASLVGSEVTKKNGSFIRIERRVKKDVPVERKNYVNYIDYQEAKAATNNKRYIGESKSILGKFLNTNNNSSDNDSTMVSLDKASRDSRRELEFDKNMLEQRVSEAEKRTNSGNLIELRSVPKKDNRISNPEIMRADDPEYDLINKMFEVEQERVINLSFLPYLLLILLWIGIIGFLIISKNDDYYFSEDDNRIAKENIDKDSSSEDMNDYQGTSKSGQHDNTSSNGFTSIVYDNQYFEQFTIKDLNDVVNLIESDSLKQKSKCPSSIVAIENDIINNYDVVAVNLCEMDYDFARELRDVVKYVYDNYPSARDYLTNLTLANVGDEYSFIAAFMPVFTFATSNTSTGYPVAIKTQILLNADYFLNTAKLISSVRYGSESGYFPPNATRSSTVAHEFGHYLSYVALLNYYNTKQLNFVKSSNVKVLYSVYDDFNAGDFSKKVLEEAYAEYQRSYSTKENFDEFRASISQYAVSKDKTGQYIYDETIAEAFHDCYLNGDNAKIASKIIMKVLLQYL